MSVQLERSTSPRDCWLDVLPPQADCLRDYQREQMASLAKAMHSGHRRVLMQSPTGSGKTHLIAAIVAAATLAGLRVLVLATRTRLVRQLHERLEAFGVRHGVVAAPLPELLDHAARVQISSVDTLHRRAVAAQWQPLPPAELVIFDEAHLATADTRLNILDSYPHAIRIGFTATPARKSGTSLGVAFEHLILGPSVRELTAAGMLVPARIFNEPVVSQKELRSVPKDADNDYQASALGQLLIRPKLVGDVLENWLRIANRRRTLVFAVNKAHAASLLEAFQRHGVATEMLTDQDDEATREEVIERLESGQTQVVVNVFLLSLGTDIPSVECIVLARPTRSLVMYLQQIGRGLRPSPDTGKADCIVIDHGHVIANLGLPHSDFGWTLDGNRNVGREAFERARNAAHEAVRTCRECSMLWLTSEQGHVCPECGWKPTPKARPIGVQQADLEELTEQDAAAVGDARVMEFYRQACGWYAKRWPDRWMARQSSGRWASWMWAVEKFRFPEGSRMPSAFWNISPLTPTSEVSGWLQYALIKRARSKAKPRAA
jgi:DNA repair protein RadD